MVTNEKKLKKKEEKRKIFVSFFYLDNLPRAKEEIQKKISKAESPLTLTTDSWTSGARESYLVITAHFLIQWKMEHHILSLPQLRESHTGKNLAKVLEMELEEWRIKVAVFLSQEENMGKESQKIIEIGENICDCD